MIFTAEFLREMSYKAGLIRKLEVARVNQPQEYFALTRKYKVDSGRFNTLPARVLKEIVEEIRSA